MFGRILDVIFGAAKSLSGSMTAVAVLLTLVALVAVEVEFATAGFRFPTIRQSPCPQRVESVKKSGGQKWVAGRQEFSSSASGASSKP
jgi:hypothetical protein